MQLLKICFGKLNNKYLFQLPSKYDTCGYLNTNYVLVYPIVKAIAHKYSTILTENLEAL